MTSSFIGDVVVSHDGKYICSQGKNSKDFCYWFIETGERIEKLVLPANTLFSKSELIIYLNRFHRLVENI